MTKMTAEVQTPSPPSSLKQQAQKARGEEEDNSSSSFDMTMKTTTTTKKMAIRTTTRTETKTKTTEPMPATTPTTFTNTKKTPYGAATRRKAPMAILDAMTTLRQCMRCHICKDMMIDPATLSCSHSFCFECIMDYTADKENCPVNGCGLPCGLVGGCGGAEGRRLSIKTIRTNPQLSAVVSSYRKIHGAILSSSDYWWEDNGEDGDINIGGGGCDQKRTKENNKNVLNICNGENIKDDDRRNIDCCNDEEEFEFESTVEVRNKILPDDNGDSITNADGALDGENHKSSRCGGIATSVEEIISPAHSKKKRSKGNAKTKTTGNPMRENDSSTTMMDWPSDEKDTPPPLQEETLARSTTPRISPPLSLLPSGVGERFSSVGNVTSAERLRDYIKAHSSSIKPRQSSFSPVLPLPRDVIDDENDEREEAAAGAGAGEGGEEGFSVVHHCHLSEDGSMHMLPENEKLIGRYDDEMTQTYPLINQSGSCCNSNRVKSAGRGGFSSSAVYFNAMKGGGGGEKIDNGGNTSSSTTITLSSKKKKKKKRSVRQMENGEDDDGSTNDASLVDDCLDYGEVSGSSCRFESESRKHQERIDCYENSQKKETSGKNQSVEGQLGQHKTQNDDREVRQQQKQTDTKEKEKESNIRPRKRIRRRMRVSSSNISSVLENAMIRSNVSVPPTTTITVSKKVDLSAISTTSSTASTGASSSSTGAKSNAKKSPREARDGKEQHFHGGINKENEEGAPDEDENDHDDDDGRPRFVFFHLNENIDFAKAAKTCFRRGWIDPDDTNVLDCERGGLAEFLRGDEKRNDDVSVENGKNDGSGNIKLVEEEVVIPQCSTSSSSSPSTRVCRVKVDRSIGCGFGRSLFRMTHAIVGRGEYATCDGYLVKRSFGYLAAVAAGVPIIHPTWLLDAVKMRRLPSLLGFSYCESSEDQDTNNVRDQQGRADDGDNDTVSAATVASRRSNRSRSKRSKTTGAASSSSSSSTVQLLPKVYEIIACTEATEWMAPRRSREARAHRRDGVGQQRNQQKKQVAEGGVVKAGCECCGRLLHGYTFFLYGEFDHLPSSPSLSMSVQCSKNSGKGSSQRSRRRGGKGSGNNSNISKNKPMMKSSEVSSDATMLTPPQPMDNATSYSIARIVALLELCGATEIYHISSPSKSRSVVGAMETEGTLSPCKTRKKTKKKAAANATREIEEDWCRFPLSSICDIIDNEVVMKDNDDGNEKIIKKIIVIVRKDACDDDINVATKQVSKLFGGGRGGMCPEGMGRRTTRNKKNGNGCQRTRRHRSQRKNGREESLRGDDMQASLPPVVRCNWLLDSIGDFKHAKGLEGHI